MKKYSIVIFLFLASTITNNLSSQSLNIGFKGGVNFANMLEKSDDYNFSEDLNYKFTPGYNLGIMVEAVMDDGLIGESGIYLNTRGYRIDEGDDENGVKGTFTTLWIDVPFKAKAAKMVGPVNFFASGGVSGGIGLSGKMDIDYTILGNTTSNEEDVVWGDDPAEADLIRIDYGALGSVGLEFKSIILEASYYHGLANLSPDTDNGYIISSRYFSVSLGYKFGL